MAPFGPGSPWLFPRPDLWIASAKATVFGSMLRAAASVPAETMVTALMRGYGRAFRFTGRPFWNGQYPTDTTDTSLFAGGDALLRLHELVGEPVVRHPHKSDVRAIRT
ncbi:hypothetical protein GCM10010381_00880 [Streptomyces xantholiticus]|nr:hypothetical protein GCM10010381_00880 [Streptomyces xantholiticus]